MEGHTQLTGLPGPIRSIVLFRFSVLETRTLFSPGNAVVLARPLPQHAGLVSPGENLMTETYHADATNAKMRRLEVALDPNMYEVSPRLRAGSYWRNGQSVACLTLGCDFE